MFLIIITIVILVILFLVYKFIISPKLLYNWYKNILQSLGYKVVCLPLNPFKITIAENQAKNQKQNNDAFYDQKNKWKDNDIVLSNTGNIITLTFLRPQLIKHFFAPTKQQLFKKSHVNKAAFNLILKNSLILDENEDWKRKRKVFSDIFNYQFIKRSLPKMVNITSSILDQMQNNINFQQQKTKQLDLKPIFSEIIGQIVIKIFFGGKGIKQKIQNQSINSYLSNILIQARKQSKQMLVLLLGQKVYTLGLTAKYRQLYNRIKTLRSVVKSLMAQRLKLIDNSQKNGQYTDLFQAICYLNQQKSQKVIDQEEIISQFCAFLTGSSDTAGNYINVLLFYIVKNRQIYQKLTQITQKHMPFSRDITYNKLRDFQLLQFCQLQTTRMYGPATNILLRQAIKDTYIQNIPIVKNTGIKIQMLSIHYNQSFYKNSNKFDPLRWQDKQPDVYTLGGFGFGSHTCLGKHLALLASKIIITLMLTRYSKIQIKQQNKLKFVYKGVYQPERLQFRLISKQKKQNNKNEKIREIQIQNEQQK